MNLEQLKQLAEEYWEGCDGCTEQDKYFWTKGYQAGYNRATPTEISDDRTKLHWKTSLVIHTPKEISDEEYYKDVFYQKQVMNPYSTGEQSYTDYEKGFMDCAKWYREQLKCKGNGENK